MDSWTVLNREWKTELATLFRSASSRLVISSPFLTKDGASYLLGHLAPTAPSAIKIRILTDLSPVNICQASTDPIALQSLANAVSHFTLLHLPKLHAKVYIADSHRAIVTSANLTAGGLYRNYEYGLKITDPHFVQQIAHDITDYSELGALVTKANLVEYCSIAERLRASYKKQQNSIQKAVRKEFERHVLSAEDELIRLRLAGGAMHTVFAKTILYLLTRHGPLSTVQLHPKIQAIHPDLCDDTVERVIDGKHFGKKWKHAVRTAQQQLKRTDMISLTGDLWSLTS